MRLSLNGWPPLASHLACLLVGAGFAQLGGRPATVAAARLAPRRVLLVLERREVPAETVPNAATHAMSPTVTVARRTSSGTCLLGDARVEVLRTDTQLVLSTALRSARQLAAAADEALAGRLALIDTGAAHDYPPCRREPEVIFGTP